MTEPAAPTPALADASTADAAQATAAQQAPQAQPGELATGSAVPVPTAADQPPVEQAEASQPDATTPADVSGAANQSAKKQAGEQAKTAANANGDNINSVDPATSGDGSVLTAAPAQAAPPPKKTGLFAFFGSSSKPKTTSLSSRDGGGAPAAAPTKRNPVATTGQIARSAPTEETPELNMASLDLGDSAGAQPEPASQRASAASDDGGLPGVRQSALFDIKRRSGMDDDSDVDIYEDAPVVVASAAGMARMAPNGLLKQHDEVDVACLKPALVRLLKQIEGRYGRKLIVTSGYRSPAHNRRARGAKNSQHMYCAAADIQVPGVGKWELAKFARALPGRGGVGTYCHTESVHVDVGPNRDWNWRCRGRRKK
jgi:uncharacterized protein YcbK (DUF882 family)